MSEMARTVRVSTRAIFAPQGLKRIPYSADGVSSEIRVFSDVDTSNIRRKLAVIGTLLIAAPLLTLSLAAGIVLQRVSQTAVISGVRTSNARLLNLTHNLVAVCRIYQQAGVDTLKSGRRIVDAAGSIYLNQSRLLTWRAKNAATGQIMELRLPVMAAGEVNFLPVPDFSHPAPLVDEIEKMNGTPATIFQRMNERGDMLRISTSTKSDAGFRDISTYIPAADSGQTTALSRAVLAGETYLGTAFFSKTNYLTAYQPLQDQTGQVVGMLFTALAEEHIITKVRSLEARHTGVNRVGLFAWRASAEDRGAALIMADKSLEGQDLWNRKDSSGRLYVQEICSRALSLPAGDVAEYKYQAPARVGAIPRTMIARFAYVPELDWVVGYAQPEADFLAGATALQPLLDWGMWLLLAAGVAAGGLAVRVWIKLSGDLAGKLSRFLTDLAKNANQLSVAAVELSAEAKRATAEIQLAIRHIDASSDSVHNVMEAVDQIAFATNMLAVNSALEASHSAAARQPMAGIAEELRKSAERCRDAARETQTELQHSRFELQKGNKEVPAMLNPQPQLNDANTAVRNQAENLLHLAAGISQTVERISAYLELEP